MDTCRHGRRGPDSSLFGVNTAGGFLRCVPSHYIVNHSVVATHLRKEDKQWIRAKSEPPAVAGGLITISEGYNPKRRRCRRTPK
jgi:hypothetical protein